MTPTPNNNRSLVTAVSLLPTAMATPVPAAADPPQIAPLPAGAPSLPSSSSAGPASLTTPEVLDCIQFRERQLLFAHAGSAPFPSRTRGFVQHVV